MEELNINLNNQQNRKWSIKALRILAVVMLLLGLANASTLFVKSSYSIILAWFYTFYFLLFALSLFLQSKGSHLLDIVGKSYLKINDDGVVYKPGMFDKKVIKFAWKDVEFISIKLFEIKVKFDRTAKTVNLEKLTDENLFLVKEIFKKHRKEILENEMPLVEY